MNANENEQGKKLEWSANLLDGSLVTKKEAEKAVAELGEGWRLPTLTELFETVDHGKFNPAADVEKYPDVKSEPYWTSTPCAWNESARWVVYFNYGLVDYDYDRACVRACRPSQ